MSEDPLSGLEIDQMDVVVVVVAHTTGAVFSQTLNQMVVGQSGLSQCC